MNAAPYHAWMMVVVSALASS